MLTNIKKYLILILCIVILASCGGNDSDEILERGGSNQNKSGNIIEGSVMKAKSNKTGAENPDLENVVGAEATISGTRGLRK